MRKIIILLLSLVLFSSCKNDSEKTELQITEDGIVKTAKQSDGLTLVTGEFIYYNDAAVIQMGNSIYGVVINDKMHELNDMGKEFRTEPTDGITVQVRGKIIAKAEGEETWPYKVEIKEILSVKKLDPTKNEVVKIGQ